MWLLAVACLVLLGLAPTAAATRAETCAGDWLQCRPDADVDTEEDELAALQLRSGRAGLDVDVDVDADEDADAEEDMRDSTGPGIWQPEKSRCRFLPAGQTLQEPPVVDSPMTLHVTTMQVCDVGRSGKQSWFTRAYALPGAEPSIPGPTLRVHPGQELKVTVVNDLAPPSPDCDDTREANDPAFNNTVGFCNCNTTNLHVHGLHVSPKSGGDDVFEMWPPGTTNSLTVTLPENHATGTYWYHPHNHHSTANQAGGGMHGAIWVQDPEGLVPKKIEEMPTKTVVLSLIDMQLKTSITDADSPAIEEQSLGDLWKNQDGQYVNRNDTVYLLVNGMWKPRIFMRDTIWTRLNMVYATIEYNVVITAVPDSLRSLLNGFYCEFQLLAKDGVYLNTAPRKISKIYLASGNRADVAVRCGCKRGYRGRCKGALYSVPDLSAPDSSGGSSNQTAEDMKDGPPQTSTGGPFAHVSQKTLNQLFMKISVQRTNRRPCTLPKFQVRRPCYLVDLRGVDVPPEDKGVISLPAPGPPTNPQWQVVYWSNVTTPFDYQGQPLAEFTDQPPLRNFSIGTVQELRFNGPPSGANQTNASFMIGGVQAHPLHIHVTPYQVISLRCDDGRWITEGGCDTETFYQVGDWQDTLMQAGGQAIVRFQLSTFTGNMVLHCHILSHEDQGMMAYFNVSGEEGTVWPGQKEVDPQCYSGYFKGGLTELS